MTIDEAIRHCEEIAEQNETQAEKIGRQFIGSAMDKYATACRKCAAEHRQLAEWLTELKNRREVSEIEKRSIEKCDKCSDILDCPLYYPWLKE